MKKISWKGFSTVLEIWAGSVDIYIGPPYTHDRDADEQLRQVDEVGGYCWIACILICIAAVLWVSFSGG